MTKVLAAQLTGYGGIDQFALDELDLPDPGPGQVRVRVAGAAINPVDIKLRKGYLQDWIPLDLPAVIGNDVSGVVDAVGDGVDALKVGDRVAGLCDPALFGAYAAATNVWAATLVKVPEALDLVDAAALPTGVLTGSQLVERAIAPSPGDLIFVAGAGGSTGRAAVLAALDAGARVIAGIRSTSRASVADLPVEAVVDLEADALPADVDAVADTVGGTAAERLFSCLRSGGKFVSIGVPAPTPPAGANIQFSTYVVEFDGARLSRFMDDMIAKNRTAPVAARFQLRRVGEAHAFMEAGGIGGKVILTP
ncbi:MAG: hypothetical protein ABS75_23550 [Pelagibacterium sp. SCN 63-23]|nr:MAG: hypothetical protein ABS75_23550 [Pelagibacterium sp. SCN 63-23]